MLKHRSGEGIEDIKLHIQGLILRRFIWPSLERIVTKCRNPYPDQYTAKPLRQALPDFVILNTYRLSSQACNVQKVHLD